MKYMGNKNRIAKEILPIILKDRTENQIYVDGVCFKRRVIKLFNKSYE